MSSVVAENMILIENDDVAGGPSEGHPLTPPARATRVQQAATLCAVLIPFADLILAFGLLWGRAITWVELSLFLGMYLAAGFGVTVGYHRLFAHRSFVAVRPVEFLLAVLGSMAVQGSVLRWVAVHRRHHQHSDQAEDPHSPHHSGEGAHRSV